MYSTDSPDLTPLPEHEWLANLAGKWDIECEYFYGDAEPAITTTAVDTARMMGPFWLVDELTIDMLASPIRAMAFTTFSPLRRTFITRWVDSSMPYPYRFEGRYNRPTRQLKMGGMNYDPVHRVESLYRSTTTFPDDAMSERILELDVESPEGERIPVLRYHMRRRAGK